MGARCSKPSICITEGMTSLDKLAADPRILVRHGAAIEPRGQCVLYRMRRTQRALDNLALETAIAVANLLEQPVVVFFGLLADHPLANLRHYSFYDRRPRGDGAEAGPAEHRPRGPHLLRCELGPAQCGRTRSLRWGFRTHCERRNRADRVPTLRQPTEASVRLSPESASSSPEVAGRWEVAAIARG